MMRMAGVSKPDGDAAKGGFCHDFLEGWSWSLHRKTLVIVLIVAALVNFGVNGIQYAIQLHLVSCGTNATLIGFISGGISLTMLVGSLLAGKLSDKVQSDQPCASPTCSSACAHCRWR